MSTEKIWHAVLYLEDVKI